MTLNELLRRQRDLIDFYDAEEMKRTFTPIRPVPPARASDSPGMARIRARMWDDLEVEWDDGIAVPSGCEMRFMYATVDQLRDNFDLHDLRDLTGELI